MGMINVAEKIAKLPAWARDHIEQQRREIERLKDAQTALYGIKPTTIEIDPYRALGEARHFIPDRMTVRYALKGGDLDVMLRNGRVSIQTTAKGDAWMDIQPSASNSFTVGFEASRR